MEQARKLGICESSLRGLSHLKIDFVSHPKTSSRFSSQYKVSGFEQIEMVTEVVHHIPAKTFTETM